MFLQIVQFYQYYLFAGEQIGLKTVLGTLEAFDNKSGCFHLPPIS